MKTTTITGAGGFIGSHLVKRLKKEGYFVIGVDIKYPDFDKSAADEFIIQDLTLPYNDEIIFKKDGLPVDEVYALAAWMGGAGVIFSGEYDALILHNNILINAHTAESCRNMGVKKVFFSSSACMYPAYNQTDPDNPKCSEDSWIPSAPDSPYGWEKLMAEQIYLAYKKNYNLNVKIARYHNIFGPLGTWQGNKEKAPAAICRKIALLPPSGGEIEVWGDGNQTRSFLYIDECVEGTMKLMDSNFTGPVNIGSEEMVTINQLAEMVAEIAGKPITIKHIPGPLGVRGRNSDNKLIKEKLGWEPTSKLYDGLKITYEWIKEQVEKERK